jgi:hypothetical protein
MKELLLERHAHRMAYSALHGLTITTSGRDRRGSKIEVDHSDHAGL